MTTPGFNADASIYRSLSHYATVSYSASELMPPMSAAALLLPRGGGPCPPGMGLCAGSCCPGKCCGNQCCIAPKECCINGCTDVLSDPRNCGACGHACPANQPTCSRGLCCPTGQSNSDGICCPTGLTNCGGACVDTKNDLQHCGSCNPCPAGSTSCQDWACYPSPTPPICNCVRTCDVTCCKDSLPVNTVLETPDPNPLARRPQCYLDPQTHSECVIKCCQAVGPGQFACTVQGSCACL
jgi:hypothetical protein